MAIEGLNSTSSELGKHAEIRVRAAYGMRPPKGCDMEERISYHFKDENHAENS